MESSPKAVAAGSAVVVILAAIVAWSQLRTPGGSGEALGSLYFTVDEGKTLFEDAAGRQTPFDKDGKPAVQAVVFSCDENKTKFVGYLKRLAARAGTDVTKGPVAMQASYEIKRPGDGKWVAYRSPDGAKILQVKCPSGTAQPREVTP